MKKYFLVEVYLGANRILKVYVRSKSLSSSVDKFLSDGYMVLVNSVVYMPTLKTI